MTLVILWVSWCKNKSFWQRFTCNNCNAIRKNISRIYGCINNPVLSELFLSNLFDLCIGHLILIEWDWKCRFEIIWTSTHKSFQSSLVSIIGATLLFWSHSWNNSIWRWFMYKRHSDRCLSRSKVCHSIYSWRLVEKSWWNERHHWEINKVFFVNFYKNYLNDFYDHAKLILRPRVKHSLRTKITVTILSHSPSQI